MPAIGLNLLYLAPGLTGGSEVYARALVPALCAAWPQARWVAFAGRELAAEMLEAPWAPGLETVTIPVSSRTRVVRSAAEQTLLAAAVARQRVDLLHSLANTAPVLAPPPAVVSILDVIHRRMPETHAGVLGAGMAALVRVAARRARRIITLSEASRGDIVRFLGVSVGKVDVVPCGPGITPGAAPTPPAELRARLELGRGPIVLSLSAKRPHKNLERLIDAIARLDGDRGPVLVVPGYPTPFEAALLERAHAAGVADRVKLPGWISREDLEGLFAAADCLAFPSLGEGFGLPVLEAMVRGLPVACANATSLPEVAGDAALLFDPLSVDAIAGAIGRILGDRELAAELARRGRERAAGFTWERAAELTIDTYRRVLG